MSESEREVLERFLMAGWITSFADVDGRGWHIRWTEGGGCFSTVWRWAFVLCDLQEAVRRPAFWQWLEDGNDRMKSFQNVWELRQFLGRCLTQLGDTTEGQFRDVFLELCVRYAPGTENGI